MFFRHPYENNGGVFVFFIVLIKNYCEIATLAVCEDSKVFIGHNYHIYQPRFISVVWRFAFYQGSRTPYKRSHVSPLSRQRKWKCRWCCRSIGISDNPYPNHRGSERSKVQILAVARFNAKSVFHIFILNNSHPCLWKSGCFLHWINPQKVQGQSEHDLPTK